MFDNRSMPLGQWERTPGCLRWLLAIVYHADAGFSRRESPASTGIRAADIELVSRMGRRRWLGGKCARVGADGNPDGRRL